MRLCSAGGRGARWWWLLAVLGLAAGGCGRRAPESDLVLVCTGDVMLGRGVARACAERGPDYPFLRVAPYLRQADLVFGNLEGPLTDLPTRIPRVNALHASPALAPVLRRAGFRVLSVANNHAIDYGRPGLAQCEQALVAAGLTPVGAGPTQAAAERGAVVSVRGVPVGLLAYSAFPEAAFVPDPQAESVLDLNEACLQRTLPALRRRCRVLVVSFHWGREGRREVTPAQRRLAHLAVDLGADLVVGHHSHVRAELERYGRGLIAYGLGNLVFDDLSSGGNEGYLLTCRYRADGKLAGYSAAALRVVACQAQVAADLVPARGGAAAPPQGPLKTRLAAGAIPQRAYAIGRGSPGPARTTSPRKDAKSCEIRLD